MESGSSIPRATAFSWFGQRGSAEASEAARSREKPRSCEIMQCAKAVRQNSAPHCAPHSATQRHSAPQCAAVRHSAPQCATQRRHAPQCATAVRHSAPQCAKCATVRQTAFAAPPLKLPVPKKREKLHKTSKISQRHRLVASRASRSATSPPAQSVQSSAFGCGGRKFGDPVALTPAFSQRRRPYPWAPDSGCLNLLCLAF